LVVRYHVARGELVNHTDTKDLVAEKRRQAAIKNGDVIATSYNQLIKQGIPKEQVPPALWRSHRASFDAAQRLGRNRVPIRSRWRVV
jgi:hypothetical protein